MSKDFQLLLSFLVPIRDLLLDDSITEIMGNPDGSWWYERAGKLSPASGVVFPGKNLHTAIEVIANNLDRTLNADHRFLNVQFPDGSRLAAVLPPVVRPYPSITIRKFPRVRMNMAALVAANTLPDHLANHLREQVVAGRTILISGGTGSGKTTLLNALADYIPETERVVVLEDTAELRVQTPNILAAECQSSTHLGLPGLLKQSLRWRPDRIIVGEVRDDEARTLLDSFNTGHAGTMATIHASSAAKALRRFTELAMRSHQQATRDDISSEVAESVDLVIQIRRYPDARRIAEVVQVQSYDRGRSSFELVTLYDINERPLPTFADHRRDRHATA